MLTIYEAIYWGFWYLRFDKWYCLKIRTYNEIMFFCISMETLLCQVMLKASCISGSCLVGCQGRALWLMFYNIQDAFIAGL